MCEILNKIRVCACCGKSRIISGLYYKEYIYKVNGKFCCSYNCFRKLQNLVDNNKNNVLNL